MAKLLHKRERIVTIAAWGLPFFMLKPELANLFMQGKGKLAYLFGRCNDFLHGGILFFGQTGDNLCLRCRVLGNLIDVGKPAADLFGFRGDLFRNGRDLLNLGRYGSGRVQNLLEGHSGILDDFHSASYMLRDILHLFNGDQRFLLDRVNNVRDLPGGMG